MEMNKRYTSRSQILTPRQLAIDILSDIKKSQFLAWRLLVRDISARYRQTLTGYWIAILPPIVTAIIFIILNQSAILNVSDTGIPYPVFVITGTILWTLFMDSINAPLNEVQNNRSMLVRVSFAKEALLFTSFGQVFFNFIIKMIILIAVLLLFKTKYTFHWFFVILPVLSTATLGVLLGVLLVPLSILYHDLRQGIIMVFSVLMYFAPVAYPLPESGIISILGKYNPMTYFLSLFRNLLFKENVDFIGISMVMFFVSLILLLLGLVLFRIAIPYIAERMDA